MNAKVNMLLMPILLLLLLDVVVASTSTKVVSFSKAEERGSLMCTTNVPDKTVPSSSLKDCSLNCSHDDICSGFNIKDSVTCDHVVSPVVALTSRTQSPVMLPVQ